MQQIFERLAPLDFNSARHTCRLWFISSLNSQLLIKMLRRMGYSDGVIDKTSNVPSGFRTLSPEWVMSKRVARECALGPENSRMSKSYSAPYEVSTTDGSRMFENNSALCEVSQIDFTEIETHYPGPDLASTTFTVSSCGRFLMAANGCLVYVYELNRSHMCGGSAVHPGLLRPITSVICPRRILACSMDTSSQRYAIAILLDGRMGLVCDISVPDPSLYSSTSVSLQCPQNVSGHLLTTGRMSFRLICPAVHGVHRNILNKFQDMVPLCRWRTDPGHSTETFVRKTTPLDRLPYVPNVDVSLSGAPRGLNYIG